MQETRTVAETSTLGLHRGIQMLGNALRFIQRSLHLWLQSTVSAMVYTGGDENRSSRAPRARTTFACAISSMDAFVPVYLIRGPAYNGFLPGRASLSW